MAPVIQNLVEDLEDMRLKGLDLIKELELLKEQLVAGITCVDDCTKRCDIIKASIDVFLNKLEKVGQ